MRMMLVASTVFLAATVFAADAVTTQTESPLKKPQATKENSEGRKIAATGVTGEELARKSMDLADSLARALGGESANCELEVYETELYDVVNRGVNYDRKVQIPASVQKHFARNVAYRSLILDRNPTMDPADAKRALDDTTMHSVAVTSMLQGQIDFRKDGTFSFSRGMWNDEKSDFDSLTTTGKWKVMATKDWNGVAVVLNENIGKRTKTRSYRFRWGGQTLGLAPANRVKKNPEPNYMDFAFVAHGGGCEH